MANRKGLIEKKRRNGNLKNGGEVEKIGIRKRRVRRREEDWELEGPYGKSIPSTKLPTEGI